MLKKSMRLLGRKEKENIPARIPCFPISNNMKHCSEVFMVQFYGIVVQLQSESSWWQFMKICYRIIMKTVFFVALVIFWLHASEKILESWCWECSSRAFFTNGSLWIRKSCHYFTILFISHCFLDNMFSHMSLSSSFWEESDLIMVSMLQWRGILICIILVLSKGFFFTIFKILSRYTIDIYMRQITFWGGNN